MTTDSTALAARIKARLQALGKSPTGASKEAGLSASAIRNIFEAKSRSPRGETLSALARVLETSEQWLLTGEEADEPGPTAAFSDARRRFLACLFRELFRRIGASEEARADLADPVQQEVWAGLFAKLATTPRVHDEAVPDDQAARSQVDAAFLALVRAGREQ